MVETATSYPKLPVREYVKRRKKMLSEVTFPKLPVRDDSERPKILTNETNEHRSVSKREEAKKPLLVQDNHIHMASLEMNHDQVQGCALEPLNTSDEKLDETEDTSTLSYNSDEQMMDIHSSDESVLNDENVSVGSSRG